MATWRDILFQMADMEAPIRATDIARKLNIPATQISRRIEILRSWGYVKYADRQRKGYKGFVVTEHGKRCAQRWKE